MRNGGACGCRTRSVFRRPPSLPIRSPGRAGRHTRISLRGPSVQAPPEPFHEDVVEEPTFAVHGDGPLEPAARPCSIVMISGGPNLWMASFRASTQNSFDLVLEPMANKVSFLRVRNAPGGDGTVAPVGPHLARVPIHDRHQIPEPAPYRQIGDVCGPELAGAIHRQPAQQTGRRFVPLRRLAGVRLPAQVGSVSELARRHWRPRSPSPSTASAGGCAFR